MLTLRRTRQVLWVRAARGRRAGGEHSTDTRSGGGRQRQGRRGREGREGEERRVPAAAFSGRGGAREVCHCACRCASGASVAGRVAVIGAGGVEGGGGGRGGRVRGGALGGELGGRGVAVTAGRGGEGLESHVRRGDMLCACASRAGGGAGQRQGEIRAEEAVRAGRSGEALRIWGIWESDAGARGDGLMASTRSYPLVTKGSQGPTRVLSPSPPPPAAPRLQIQIHPTRHNSLPTTNPASIKTYFSAFSLINSSPPVGG